MFQDTKDGFRAQVRLARYIMVQEIDSIKTTTTRLRYRILAVTCPHEHEPSAAIEGLHNWEGPTV